MIEKYLVPNKIKEEANSMVDNAYDYLYKFIIAGDAKTGKS